MSGPVLPTETASGISVAAAPLRDPAALHYCRERVLLADSALSLALPFIPSRQHDAWIAMQGLLADLLEIPEEVSETLVGYSKLSWWYEQLKLPLAQAAHPSLRAVRVATGQEHLVEGHVTALLNALRGVLERPGYQDEEEIWTTCLQLGRACLDLELAALGYQTTAVAEVSRSGLAHARALHYFLRMLHHGGSGSSAWPFPLNLQARYQINRQSFGHNLAATRALVRDLLSRLEAHLPRPSELDRTVHHPAILPILLTYTLERRLLRRYRDRPDRLLRHAAGRRWNPIDVLSLWWQALRLRTLR